MWGLENNPHLEKVHTYALKRFINVPLHSSNKIVYGETGRYPLYIRTYVKCIKYWLKLVKLPLSRLCAQAYEMLRRQQERGRDNWATKVKQVLMENGFGIVWMCQGVGHDLEFIREFRDRLIDSYKQNWHFEVENNDKYSWFFSFKSIFHVEKYLLVLTKKWYRDMLARFRTRTL